MNGLPDRLTVHRGFLPIMFHKLSCALFLVISGASCLAPPPPIGCTVLHATPRGNALIADKIFEARAPIPTTPVDAFQYR